MFSLFKKRPRVKTYILKDLEIIRKCESLHEIYLWERKQGKPATQNFKTWLNIVKMKGEARL